MEKQTTKELTLLLNAAFEQGAWATANAILAILKSRASELQYGY